VKKITETEGYKTCVCVILSDCGPGYFRVSSQVSLSTPNRGTHALHRRIKSLIGSLCTKYTEIQNNSQHNTNNRDWSLEGMVVSGLMS